MPVKPADYLMLMFAMKGVGRRVDFAHVKEKVGRDVGKISDAALDRILTELVTEGMLELKANQYGVTEQGRAEFVKIFPKVEPELRRVNEPWVIVYRAKQYYPHVADTVVEFCKGRNVGFYCLFTEERFFRRDWRGKKITINSTKDLLFFIDMHYIDVIPCVHRIGVERPDWLVVDIDPGPKVPWGRTKEVARLVYRIFDKLKLNPVMKFSGSRGFQVWSLIKDFPLPEKYQPLVQGKRERNYFSLFADFVRLIQGEVDKELPGVTTSEAARKAERADLVLLDPASMKPAGLVRSPYAVHSKTGLVSLPISIAELKSFKPKDATTDRVLVRYRARGNEFILKPANPAGLLKLL